MNPSPKPGAEAARQAQPELQSFLDEAVAAGADAILLE